MTDVMIVKALREWQYAGRITTDRDGKIVRYRVDGTVPQECDSFGRAYDRRIETITESESCSDGTGWYELALTGVLETPTTVAPNIVIWRPRNDEHDLAQSLGMVDGDAGELSERIDQAREMIERDHPDSTVTVKRWRVSLVIGAMADLGVTNTPVGRDLAYRHLLAPDEE